MFDRMLVGFDGSVGSRGALDAALRLAAELHASILVVIVQHHLPRAAATVGEVDEERQVEAAEARRLANEIDAHTDGSGVEVQTTVVHGHPAHEILRLAREHKTDVIVLGHTGHAVLRGMLLGAIPEHVTRHAPCSVLIVR